MYDTPSTTVQVTPNDALDNAEGQSRRSKIPEVQIHDEDKIQFNQRFAVALNTVTELDKSLERYVALDPGVVREVKHILHGAFTKFPIC